MKINLSEISAKYLPTKYKIKHDWLTANNLLRAGAVVVAVFWMWGNVQAMSDNHSLLQEMERKRREAKMAEIQEQTLRFEQNYLKSAEYQELAAREKLGLVAEGEHVLILPDYLEEKEEKAVVQKRSNFSEWMNFLFGGNAKRIEK